MTVCIYTKVMLAQVAPPLSNALTLSVQPPKNKIVISVLSWTSGIDDFELFKQNKTNNSALFSSTDFLARKWKPSVNELISDAKR